MTAKSDYHTQQIPVDDIFVVGNRRGVNDEAVSALVESIGAIGLQTPITVRIQEDVPDPETGEVLSSAYAIVAGRHRHEACRRLGWKYIPAIVREDCSEVDAELWEIAENLCRADLTKDQRDQNIRRYAELLKMRDLQSDQSAPIESKREDGRGHRQQGVASKIAAETGLSKATVNRALNPKIAPDVMAEITGSQWDKGAVLDMLKRLSHDEQRQALQRVKSGVSPSFHEAIEFIRGEDIAPARPARTVASPLSDNEAREQWIASGMSWWNRGGQEWREDFLARIDLPVFDSTRAA